MSTYPDLDDAARFPVFNSMTAKEKYAAWGLLADNALRRIAKAKWKKRKEAA